MTRLVQLLLICMVVFVGWTDAALAGQNPFRVEAEPLNMGPETESSLRVIVVVPDGYHVYRDMMWLKTLDAGGLTLGEASFPTGIASPDPANPTVTREVFDMSFVIEVPVHGGVAPGEYEPQFEVRYQGCKKSLCYMPVTEIVTASIVVEKAQGFRWTAPDGAAPLSDEPVTASHWALDLLSPILGRPALAGGTTEIPPGFVPAPQLDFTGLPASASVQTMDPQGKPHPVHARLLVDKEAVQPGGTVRLGVHLTQQAGWHTYWTSPGDIGLAPEIQWMLPKGANNTEFGFPVPARFELQNIVSYGYEDQVLLFTEVTLPEDLPVGEVVLGATANWLVCEVMCIPGDATLSLPVTVVPKGESVADNAYAPLFEHFGAQHPVSALMVQQLVVENQFSTPEVGPEQPFSLTMTIRPMPGVGQPFGALNVSESGWPHFTPIFGDGWYVLETKVSQGEENELVVTIGGESLDAESIAAGGVNRIGGLFHLPQGDEWIRAVVSVAVPWQATDAQAEQPAAQTEGAEQTDGSAVAGAASDQANAEEKPPESLAWMLLLAFFGGGLLNIMPCVLPVLTLKLYSLVEQVDISGAERRTAGLAYTAGIVLSFWLLAAAVLILKMVFGQDVLWGFQFQYPAYVAGLGTVVFLFGLSLFGVFEIPALGSNKAASASQTEGVVGYLLTGVFATLLATPCSAPFLGTGMGFAFSLPAAGVVLFFTVAGLGLAAPFLLIAFVPSLYRLLPKPGAWMEAFKELLGFTLIATTIWLVDVLAGQVGRDGATGFLAFLLFVGIGAWIFGRWGGMVESGKRQLTALAAGCAVAALGGFGFLDLSFAETEAPSGELRDEGLDFSEEIPWQGFSEARVEALAGRTVFIDFTADWCLTCKVNEQTVLETEKVRQALAAHNVVPLKADWTRRDPEITAWLQRFGKAGVPFYLVVPADRSRPEIPLPEVITPDLVVTALADGAGL